MTRRQCPGDVVVVVDVDVVVVEPGSGGVVVVVVVGAPPGGPTGTVNSHVPAAQSAGGPVVTT